MSTTVGNLEAKSILDAEYTNIALKDRAEFTYAKGGYVFEGKALNSEKMKYCVNVSTVEGEKVGYFTFFVRHQEGTVRMSGMLVERSFRGRGISKLFLTEISNIGMMAGYHFRDTTEQRKPLTCSVLRQFGFDPVGAIQEAHKVWVGRLTQGPRIGLHFTNQRQAQLFAGSRLGNLQGYAIVSTQEELQNAVWVVLGRRYKKVEEVFE